MSDDDGYQTLHAGYRVKAPAKYAGGKRGLLAQYVPLFPGRFRRYYEPFVGGGAIFWSLEPSEASIGDMNPDLMAFYLQVRDDPRKIGEIIDDWGLKRHDYERIRCMRGDMLDQETRASRFLYLNRTGYNGLWRVNARGEMNTPYGVDPEKISTPYSHIKFRARLVNMPNMLKCQEILRRTQIFLGDYRETLAKAGEGDFVFLDPPYLPRGDTTRNFTAYTAGGFGVESHRELARVYRELDARGCILMLANADSRSLVPELYDGYDLCEVKSLRSINSKSNGRGLVSEYVVRNYR